VTQTQELKPTFEITIESSQTTFSETFLEAVENAFIMFGDKASQAIYGYLKDAYGVSRADLPYKVDIFALALENLFGKASVLVELKIMATLHRSAPEFKFSLNADELSFVCYVKAFRAWL
jgi:hypothetical protein